MTGTVLITGATGFAGGFALEQYAERGWEVHGTTRRHGQPNTEVPPGVQLHHLDLLDLPRVEELIRSLTPDVVIHLAAQSSVAASWADPLGTLQVNAAAQHHLLDALARFRPNTRVLVVGSADEYGRVPLENNPVDEDQMLLPMNPYALSKVVQDLMGYEFFATQGLQVVRVRPFLQMGPRRDDRFVIGSFARQVAEITQGTREPRIETGTIDLERDFTDVRDVVRGYALAAEHGEPGVVYNIASGQGRTLRSLLSAMLHLAGVEASIHIDPARVRIGEMPVLLGDPRRLHARTGWEPVIPFEQSIADSLAFWRNHLQPAGILPGGER